MGAWGKKEIKAECKRVAAKYRGRNLRPAMMPAIQDEIRELLGLVLYESGYQVVVTLGSHGGLRFALQRRNVCCTCWGEHEVLDVTAGKWKTCPTCKGVGHG